ncbi:MAG: hypothetical protein QN732_11690 [Nitrososphaeraceae archaeon]|nr:hypothetical protein [Nitrososphaeraceae archaeon]
MGSTQEFISIKVLGLLTAIICISYVNYSRNQIFGAELGDGHNMPMATIGDRIAMLAFKSAQVPTNKNVNLDFTLLDNKTGDNIQHTTYLVSISMLIKGYSQKQFIVMVGIYLWNLFHPQLTRIG